MLIYLDVTTYVDILCGQLVAGTLDYNVGDDVLIEDMMNGSIDATVEAIEQREVTLMGIPEPGYRVSLRLHREPLFEVYDLYARIIPKIDSN